MTDRVMAPDSSGADFGALAGLLAASGRVEGRVYKVVSTYLGARSTWNLVQHVRRHIRSQLSYTIAIASDDDIYPDVQAWLLEAVPSSKMRALNARTDRSWGDSNGIVSVEEASRPMRRARLRLSYDATSELVARIDGHRVVVTLDRDGLGSPSPGGDPGDRLIDLIRRGGRSERILFTTYGTGGRDAVTQFLDGLVAARASKDTSPAFFIAERWGGGWERREDLPRRELDSVVLRAGQKEALVDDLAGFLAAEADYARLGVPYHRGYMLHGPPGTGKSSIAQALATHFNLDLYYVPLRDIEGDGNLVRLVSMVKPRSILLFEDIGTLSVVHEGEEASTSDRRGITMGGLLNCLDGVFTPHGLITVMTDNDYASLDHRVTRPGRMDRVEEIGHLDADQYVRLVRTLLPGVAVPEPPVTMRTEIVPAAVVEVVKRHLHDPAAAVAELHRLVDRTVRQR